MNCEWPSNNPVGSHVLSFFEFAILAVNTEYDFPNGTAFAMHAKICKFSGSVCWDLGEVAQINMQDYFNTNTSQGGHGSIDYSNYNLSTISGYQGSGINWTNYTEQYRQWMDYNSSRYSDNENYRNAYQQRYGDNWEETWSMENSSYPFAGVYQFEQEVTMPFILGINYTDEEIGRAHV